MLYLLMLYMFVSKAKAKFCFSMYPKSVQYCQTKNNNSHGGTKSLTLSTTGCASEMVHLLNPKQNMHCVGLHNNNKIQCQARQVQMSLDHIWVVTCATPYSAQFNAPQACWHKTTNFHQWCVNNFKIFRLKICTGLVRMHRAVCRAGQSARVRCLVMFAHEVRSWRTMTIKPNK